MPETCQYPENIPETARWQPAADPRLVFSDNPALTPALTKKANLKKY
jgi:hypothetical protein